MANLVHPVVEKGIPIPDDQRGRNATGRRAKYPWREMETGDSFWVHHKRHVMDGTIATAHTRLGSHGPRFTCRDEGAGSRVWRIS